MAIHYTNVHYTIYTMSLTIISKYLYERKRNFGINFFFLKKHEKFLEQIFNQSTDISILVSESNLIFMFTLDGGYPRYDHNLALIYI